MYIPQRTIDRPEKQAVGAGLCRRTEGERSGALQGAALLPQIFYRVVNDLEGFVSGAGEAHLQAVSGLGGDVVADLVPFVEVEVSQPDHRVILKGG